jgi:hypothetical protein
MKSPLSYLPRLWANWITLLGSVMAVTSATAIAMFLLAEFLMGGPNPYSHTLIVVGLPGFFILGLLIIPVGLFIERRRLAKQGAPDAIPEAFRKAMAEPRARRLMLFFFFASLANVVVLGLGGTQAIGYMDSPKFCGTTCHVTMEPEWVTYKDAKHSRVACVQCHIGEGAPSETKAKINGVSQVWHVITNTVSRPIPTPIENLRTARETCAHCHSPERYIGNKLKVFPHFTPDKDNTPTYNVLTLQVGGGDSKGRKAEGIHHHASEKNEVRYEYLNRERTQIGKITVLDEGKVVAEYLPSEKSRSLPVLGEQLMDCVDCHNRPTHVFDPSPRAAVDRVMGEGRLDAKTPWLAKAAADLLAAKDVPEGGGEAYFRKALDTSYATNWPDVKPSAAALDHAAATLADVYAHNVFPKMAVTWGTHRSRLGHHNDFDKDAEIGCFRCHDDEHVKTTTDGKKVKLDQDCEKCHDQIATGEDPAGFASDLKQLLPK